LDRFYIVKGVYQSMKDPRLFRPGNAERGGGIHAHLNVPMAKFL
jgi:hypothetical protein